MFRVCVCFLFNFSILHLFFLTLGKRLFFTLHRDNAPVIVENHVIWLAESRIEKNSKFFFSYRLHCVDRHNYSVKRTFSRGSKTSTPYLIIQNFYMNEIKIFDPPRFCRRKIALCSGMTVEMFTNFNCTFAKVFCEPSSCSSWASKSEQLLPDQLFNYLTSRRLYVYVEIFLFSFFKVFCPQ